jgi:hypothetical protein
MYIMFTNYTLTPPLSKKFCHSFATAFFPSLENDNDQWRSHSALLLYDHIMMLNPQFSLFHAIRQKAINFVFKTNSLLDIVWVKLICQVLLYMTASSNAVWDTIYLRHNKYQFYVKSGLKLSKPLQYFKL